MLGEHFVKAAWMDDSGKDSCLRVRFPRTTQNLKIGFYNCKNLEQGIKAYICYSVIGRLTEFKANLCCFFLFLLLVFLDTFSL